MQTDLRKCYRILEVEPGATLEEVKRAYRELVKVWHPDRFTHDPNLQRKAQEKLKQINLAYERICAGGATFRATDAGGSSGSGTAAHREAPPQPPRPASSPGQGTRRTHRLGQITVAAVIVAVVGMVFSTIESSQTRSTGNQPANSAPQLTSQAPQSPSVDAQPRVRQHLSIAQISEAYREALKKQPGLGMALQKFSRYAQEKLPDYDFSEGINYSPPKETPAPNTEISASAATAATPGTIIHAQTGSAEVETKDYFTVGSTKDEVLAVQGVPFSRSPSDGVFTYRYGSQVFFKDDRVTSWRNSRENPLKAKLESSPP